MLKRRAEHGAARERYSAPNKRHSAPFDRSAQFREVSNIEHYVGYRACKTYLHHRTLPWLMPVTESAACSRPTQESIMPSAQTDPLFSVADIGVFSCVKCGKPMRLSRSEPAEPGFDVRTFECEVQ